MLCIGAFQGSLLGVFHSLGIQGEAVLSIYPSSEIEPLTGFPDNAMINTSTG
jgi:hypothetical protein